MGAAAGKGTERGFLTGHQILKRLSQPLQDQLRAAYGDAGKQDGEAEAWRQQIVGPLRVTVGV